MPLRSMNQVPQTAAVVYGLPLFRSMRRGRHPKTVTVRCPFFKGNARMALYGRAFFTNPDGIEFPEQRKESVLHFGRLNREGPEAIAKPEAMLSRLP